MIFVCDTCLQAVELVGDVEPGILDRAKAAARCVNDSCDGKMFTHAQVSRAVKESPEKYRLRASTAEDFLAELFGMGRPEERTSIDTKLYDIMAGETIVELGMLQSPTGKPMITQLVLSNGYTIHLAGGPGAVVYKVTQ